MAIFIFLSERWFNLFQELVLGCSFEEDFILPKVSDVLTQEIRAGFMAGNYAVWGLEFDYCGLVQASSTEVMVEYTDFFRLLHVVDLGEGFDFFRLFVEPLCDSQLCGSQVADQVDFSTLNFFGEKALEGHEEIQFGLSLFSHLPLPPLRRSSDLILQLVPPEEEGEGVFEAPLFCDQI